MITFPVDPSANSAMIGAGILDLIFSLTAIAVWILVNYFIIRFAVVHAMRQVHREQRIRVQVTNWPAQAAQPAASPSYPSAPRYAPPRPQNFEIVDDT